MVLGLLLAAGALAGVIWTRVFDPADVVRFGDSVGQDEQQLGQVFTTQGWYVALATGAGLLSGFAASFWCRRDLRITALMTLLGAVLAALVMAWVGYLFGPDDPTAALRDAKAGATAPSMLTLSTSDPGLALFSVHHVVYYAVWPFTAMAGAVVALLTRHD